MNVTTSARWTRAAVGIVRVERELSYALAALFDRDDFGLCTFESGEFVEYDPETDPPATKAVLQHHVTAATPRSFPKSSTFEASFRWRQSAKSVGNSSSMLAKALPKTRRPLDSGKLAHPKRQIEFGDIIISVGLDWDHPYTNQFYKLSKERGIKIVTCCYDLIPVLFPQYCVGSVSSQFKDYFTKLSWASSLILCISERSRQDYQNLVKAIGAPEVETLVMPLGDHIPVAATTSDSATIDEEVEISHDVARAGEKPFILFVSTIERRKNHEVLYRAYHLLARSGHSDRLPRLIFVGMPGWGVNDLLKDIEFDPLTRDLIIQLNHVSDRDLAWLYKNAYFCAFPSLYEGWGLPVGEALACGKAVIASAEGSIPEVGGDLVTYLDPWNPKAWAEEILSLVDHPNRVATMEAAVQECYTPRTWHDTARVVRSGLDNLRVVEPVAITLLPGHQLETKVGVAWGEGIRSNGLAGLLTRGPSHWLPPGTFEIKIHLDEFVGEQGHIVVAFRSLGGKREHASSTIPIHGKEYLGQTHSFELTLLDQIEGYEIFTEVSSGVYVSIERIDICEMPINQSADARIIKG